MYVKYQSYFFILSCAIELSISLLLDLNHQTIEKMANSSVFQIIEIVPEPRFKSMGFYPSYKVPQLTKYSFAKINSAPSNVRGEDWIMIARLNKFY